MCNPQISPSNMMKHRFRYWMWRFFRKNFWDRTASTEASTSMHNFSTGHWCQTSAISSEPTIMYCICPLRVKTNKKQLLHFRTWVFLLRVASGISTISTMATIIRCYNPCSHHLNHVSTIFPCFYPCFGKRASINTWKVYFGISWVVDLPGILTWLWKVTIFKR